MIRLQLRHWNLRCAIVISVEKHVYRLRPVFVFYVDVLVETQSSPDV